MNLHMCILLLLGFNSALYNKRLCGLEVSERSHPRRCTSFPLVGVSARWGMRSGGSVRTLCALCVTLPASMSTACQQPLTLCASWGADCDNDRKETHGRKVAGIKRGINMETVFQSHVFQLELHPWFLTIRAICILCCAGCWFPVTGATPLPPLHSRSITSQQRAHHLPLGAGSPSMSHRDQDYLHSLLK